MTADDSDERERDAEEIAEDALAEVMDTLDDIATMADPVEQMQTEHAAIEAFADKMGEASVAGLPDSRISMYAGMIADESEYATKTDIKDDVSQATEAAIRGDDDGAGDEPINGYLRNYVERVTVIRSTDAKQSAVYRWRFDAGDGDDVFEIETGENAPSSHFDPKSLRLAIFDAVGDWPARPPQELRGGEDWTEFIVQFINAHSVDVTSIGPRSTRSGTSSANRSRSPPSRT